MCSEFVGGGPLQLLLFFLAERLFSVQCFGGSDAIAEGSGEDFAEPLQMRLLGLIGGGPNGQ